MSLLQNSNAISAGGYDINNSLRFRSSASAYLNRTPASTTNRQTWTWSGWVKRGVLGARQHIFVSANQVVNTGGQQEFQFAFNSSDQIEITGGVSGVGQDLNLTTTQVFRDPSAWYHFVILMDTTQATSSNRMKFYLNGVQVTAFGTAIYPAQNHNTAVNLINFSHRIGGSGGSYLDAYQAEVNFIDGQALTPSSFGETDAVTGVWKAKKYTGTYGTNGFYLPFTTPTTSAYAGLFNGSSHSLSVASNSVFGYGTSDFTMEGWFLFSDLSTRTLMSNLTVGGSVAPHIYYNTSAGITYYTNSADRINGGALATNKWYHIALCRSGSSTRLFVNGSQVGSTYTDSNNYGTSNPFIIADYGSPVSGVSQFYGYISNVRVVKGTALYTSNFVPPVTSLTNISGTSILTLQNSTIIDNSSNSLSITNNGSTATYAGNVIFNANITTDASGNKNHWVSNNINYSFYGTTYDAMTDSPTNTSATVANYCVLNPLIPVTTTTVTNGNLSLNAYNPGGSVFGTMGVSSGKWYFESISQSDAMSGISGTLNGGAFPGAPANAYTWDAKNATKISNSSGASYGSAAVNGDIIGVAFDLDTGSITFYKNGVSQGVAYTFTPSGNYFPVFRNGDPAGSPPGGNISVNFGQRPFAYTPPTGYVALNTYNLPTPTILQGNKYMDAKLYTGTNANQSINTYGFSPDLIWIKNRDNVESHHLVDSIRGNNKFLLSNSVAAERTGSLNNGYNQVNLASTGFDIVSNGLNDELNLTGRTYVAWGWDGGSSTVTNTSGSISSQVRANTTAGFSIVTYTGNATTNATVGHGLGVVPKFFVVKTRSGTSEWLAYHISTGKDGFMQLQSSSAFSSSANYWGSTGPTSTTFQINGGGGVNNNGSTYVAYCFSEILGYSAFGSYAANGSTDGPFVYTGFQPKFLLLKGSTSPAGTGWYIFDTTRNTYNVLGNYLSPNNTNVEASLSIVDFLSNGFKLKTTNSEFNASGQTWIYAAFAENPFKNALAR